MSHSSALLSSSNKDPHALRGEALVPCVSETDSFGFSMSSVMASLIFFHCLGVNLLIELM